MIVITIIIPELIFYYYCSWDHSLRIFKKSIISIIIISDENINHYHFLWIEFFWVMVSWFNGMSTSVGYLMPNPLHTYISNIWFVLLVLYGISTISGYLMPIPLYKLSKVGNRSRGQPEGSFFNSYNNEMQGRVLLLSLDCSTLPLIRTLYCRVLSKEVSNTIFKVFGMTQPGIEPWSPGPLVNILPTRPMSKWEI